MANIKNTTNTYVEIVNRLAFYEKAYPLIKELAEWNATTDNWYYLFDSFRNKAREIIK